MPLSLVTMSLVATPVTGARWWSTALVPHSGNWNFVVQSYNNGSGLEPEWVVVNIFSGTYTLQSGTVDVPGASNYNCRSYNYTVDHNQLFCANGRVIFPEKYTYVAYYDPADAKVHELGRVYDSVNDATYPSGNDAIYKMEFDREGWLYGGTQVRDGFKPMIFKFHTGTLSGTVLGHVGNSGGIRYAYYLAPDPPYVYVAVGQNPWELASIHTGTLSATLLARPYTAMEFNGKPEGWTVRLISGSDTQDWWVVDNTLYAYTASYNPATLPFTIREVTSSFPVRLAANAPEIDYTLGIGKLNWRATGTNDPFTRINYTVNRTASINLEAAHSLPGGAYFGSAEQYGGFFTSKTGSTVHLGFWHGISQAALVNSGSDTYMCGYPNGVLYRFNETGSWSVPTNPVSLGYFTQADMKYCYGLENSSTGRIYAVGRRERDGDGSAIGYYVTNLASFGGHHSGALASYNPRSILALDSIQKVVFSGVALTGSGLATASLLVYDMDLNFDSYRHVGTGTLDGGKIYKTSTPGVIVGLVQSPKLIYRYNVDTDSIMKTASYTGSMEVSTQRSSDYSIWAVIDGSICKIDPDTLTITRLRNVSTL